MNPTYVGWTITPVLYSDYSGFPILKTIISSNEELTTGFVRFWIFGNPSQAGGEVSPFLFINAGAATLSDSSTGFALIKDVVTQCQLQALEHDGTLVPISVPTVI